MSSPLDSSTLRAIDDCLSRGELQRAQALLAGVDATGEQAAAATYLATRLLYLRDRLAPEEVVARLQELLQTHPHFPEAESLLGTASEGIRGPRSIAPPPPGGSVMPPRPPASAPPPPLLRQPTFSSAPPRGSTRPTAQPPPGTVLASAALGEEADSERPTIAPDETAGPQTAPRKIVVDTRQSPFPRPTSPPPPHVRSARRAGGYSLMAPAPATAAGSRRPPRGSEPPDRDGVFPNGPLIPRAPSVPTFGPASDPPSQGEHRVVDPYKPPAEVRRGSWLPRQSTVPPASRPLRELGAPHELWPEVEQRLIQGDHPYAARYFSQAARQQLSHLPQASAESEFEVFAHSACEFLNKSWITHHFAPFDLSLHSLSRLQLAMATLLGGQPSERPASAVVMLIGGYVGATLRLAHRGGWVDGSDLHTARVRAGSHEWRPFETVRHWLMSGARKSLVDELGAGLAKHGTLAWSAHQKTRITPHALWQGDVGPDELPLLAAAVKNSVLAYASEILFEQPLDRTVHGLDALSAVVDVITRSARPIEGNEAWLRRTALLVGAYVGETIRERKDVTWRQAKSGEFQLGSGTISMSPMGYIITQAVSQRPINLIQYALGALGADE